ncbi:bifunctional diguanylate cyclase/phosphodiesterase [Antrihabitans sp. YC2-6]|uniref:putative bifunctional diguanylate cyclase/phosphodiesterase n=1 Tax=Antrihabitans sp. YC2-6 TaxID=2799498 RepID=UPI0018F4331A|nr:EAL domain-containing protein [Antrihabitans sp. YC2-6]MBJ8343511.1 EAL domain-containing protein [Antrihabitans sp. YC2-6]
MRLAGHRPGVSVAYAFVAVSSVQAAIALAVGSQTLCTIFLVITSLASIAALLIGILRYSPTFAMPWWLILAACITTAVGGGLSGAFSQPHDPLPLAPQSVLLTGYLLQAAAAVAWLRAYATATARTVAIDSALVGLGALITAWVVLVSPVVAGDSDVSDPRLAAASHIVVGAIVLAVITHVAYTSALGSLSFRFLYGAVVAQLVGDCLLAIDSIRGTTAPGGSFMAAYIVAYGLFAAAAVHPSMVEIGMAPDSESDRFRQRFVEVAAICLLAAAIPATRTPFGVWDQVVRAVLISLLIAGVLLRSERAVRIIADKEVDARHRAMHDELTGLSNRAALYEGHAPSERYGVFPPMNLLFMDLDNFKLVNDSYGHRTGDELIIAAAERLAGVVGDSGWVHRHGGDEFVVTTYLDPIRTDALARAILDEFSKPFVLRRVRVTLSTSIGISRTTGGNAPPNLDDLIREADSAMYHAKSRGSGNYAVFDEELRARAVEQLKVTTDLRESLDDQEFELFYQPIVDIASGETAAFEALIRWHHDGLLHNPDYFISIAESSDIIIDIGRWVLDRACAQLAAWRRAGGTEAVSVNLSARQLRDVGFVNTVVGTLAAHDLPASALWLELTETALIDDDDVALTILSRLSAFGVTICLDDFGIGYSALGNLNKYPIDVVKIDKSFIAALDARVAHNPKHRVLVTSIEAMSTALGLVTVAEGVESETQLEQVRTIGCRFAQGWLFGSPAPIMRPWTGRAESVGARAAGDSTECLLDDQQILDHRPVLDI